MYSSSHTPADHSAYEIHPFDIASTSGTTSASAPPYMACQRTSNKHARILRSPQHRELVETAARHTKMGPLPVVGSSLGTGLPMQNKSSCNPYALSYDSSHRYGWHRGLLLHASTLAWTGHGPITALVPFILQPQVLRLQATMPGSPCCCTAALHSSVLPADIDSHQARSPKPGLPSTCRPWCSVLAASAAGPAGPSLLASSSSASGLVPWELCSLLLAAPLMPTGGAEPAALLMMLLPLLLLHQGEGLRL